MIFVYSIKSYCILKMSEKRRKSIYSEILLQERILTAKKIYDAVSVCVAQSWQF